MHHKWASGQLCELPDTDIGSNGVTAKLGTLQNQRKERIGSVKIGEVVFLR